MEGRSSIIQVYDSQQRPYVACSLLILTLAYDSLITELKCCNNACPIQLCPEYLANEYLANDCKMIGLEEAGL